MSVPHHADPIVRVDDLYALPALVLLDARSGPSARADYERGHLEGARFIDMNTDLAALPEDARDGGRHPLPGAHVFAATLGRVGIGPESSVVVYDDQGGANAAARAWWMLRALGHRAVYVLDGGLQHAVQAGRPLSTNAPHFAEKEAYPQRGWLSPQASLEEVARHRLDPSYRVLDVRAAARFRGEHEPIDPIAGHIPGAINLPLTENLAADGLFRPAEQLRAQYTDLLGAVPPERLIVHCGSGVTACHTLLALDRAGLRGAHLYVGSWSEWCRHPELPRSP